MARFELWFTSTTTHVAEIDAKDMDDAHRIAELADGIDFSAMESEWNLDCIVPVIEGDAP